MIELLSDPQIWIGLVTLVVLEIVLGIDNLIFIAILADKLPPHQRDKARVIGLSLALVMRLGLLTAVSWLVTLTQALFSVGPLSFSGRDLILLIGGLFLLFKATTELHERMEGVSLGKSSSTVYASFSAVVAQIVVLDAVFSLDAVITAVGMVNNLGVMMAAVVISIGVMLFASKPLTRFVNAHPTIVILCLSFLLMIGFSLVAEGLGFHVPKGYLYAAIGFSILIETFNQLSSRNAIRHEQRVPLRERTALKVLSLMAGRSGNDQVEHDHGDPAAADEALTFAPEERIMVSGVLALADRKVRSVMTPVSDVDWVDLSDDAEAIQRSLNDNPHSHLPVCMGQVDQLQGVARAKDLLMDLMQHGAIQPSTIRKPLMVPEGAGVIALINDLRQSKGHMVIVINEFHVMSGVVTPVDVLEAIAGEFPDEDESFTIQPVDGEPDTWIASGAADVHMVQQLLGSSELVSSADAFTTVGGLLTEFNGALPKQGDVVVIDGWQFAVTEATDGVMRKIRIEKDTKGQAPLEY